MDTCCVAIARSNRATTLRHSGARALAREPGIHNPRPVVMDSGLAAEPVIGPADGRTRGRRPGMTRLGSSVSATTSDRDFVGSCFVDCWGGVVVEPGRRGPRGSGGV